MHETEMKLREVKEIKEKLTSWVKEYVSQGKEAVETKELGEVVDMIKDFAETERNCWEACYYHKVVEAMESEGEGRMGYDHWRTSSGRFADKGTGTYYGYPMPQSFNQDTAWMNNMGYSGGNSSGGGGGGNSGGSSGRSGGSSNSGGGGNSGGNRGGGSRYGYPYEEWKDARMRNDRMGMNTKGVEHVKGVVESMRDIWREADPSTREKMKHEMSALAEEMDL